MMTTGMRSLVLIASVAGAACVVPISSSSRQIVDTRYGAPFEVKASDAVRLRTDTYYTTVVVQSTQRATCQREVTRVVEITHTVDAVLEGGDVVDAAANLGQTTPLTGGVGAVGLGVVVVAAPVLIVSALITAAVIGSEDGKVERHDERTTEAYACSSRASGVEVSIGLPSGAIYRGTTNARGRLVFEIPDTEPARGSLVVESAGRTSPPVRYVRPMISARLDDRPRSACTAERRDTFARMSERGDPDARIDVLLGMSKCETTPQTEREERAWATMRTAALLALSGAPCGVLDELAFDVQDLDRRQHRQLAGVPEIARCHGTPATEPLPRALPRSDADQACLARRHAEGKAAQEIVDIQERGRAILRLPRCT